MPLRIIEGIRPTPQPSAAAQERRFAALAAAIHEHEARAGADGRRPHDESLYRTLRTITALDGRSPEAIRSA